MELKELLSLHKNCLICGSPMEYYCNDRSIKIEVDTEEVCFSHNSSKVKTNYTIIKNCIKCKGSLSPITSINNITSTEFFYSFDICNDDLGNCSFKLNREIARVYNNGFFWHLNNYYLSNSSTIFHGNIKQPLDQVFYLLLPKTIGLSNIENIEQLIKKLKLYVIMS